ncbi:DUF975 family protein [Clostridium massiliamazoniense]|uniref:DUF975 family protein n=1 Tax=Clostridium massiliamazoniense TaxID=1347366 RepID=UPI0006D80266|nr:DUF975 family protein [Clostridium massiliamazoniense]
MTRIEIKDKAKSALEGKRGNAALFLFIATIIFIPLNILLSLIPFVGALLRIVLSAIFILSITLFITTLCNSNEKLSFKEGIPNSNLITKSIIVTFLFSLIIFLVMLPTIFFMVMSFFFNSVGLLAITSILLFLFALFIQVPMIFLNYIIIDNPNASIGFIITEAFKISFKNLKRIVVMSLSLILWDLLIVVTFGLAYFYVRPYIVSIYYFMYKDIIGENKALNLEK